MGSLALFGVPLPGHGKRSCANRKCMGIGNVLFLSNPQLALAREVKKNGVFSFGFF